jgi:PleD family two-component response regulator
LRHPQWPRQIVTPVRICPLPPDSAVCGACCADEASVRYQKPPPPLTVLVADDDEDTRALIVAAVRADGHHVIETRDGIELLDRLTEVLNDPTRRPAVIVTDVLMPHL